MATKQEIIFDIITIATKANYTDDSRLDEDYLGYKVDEKRAKEIHDSYKRNFMIDPKWIQDYGICNLTPVNHADDKTFINLDVDMMKLTLPPVVYLINNMHSNNNLGFHAFRSVNSRKEYYYRPLSQLMEMYRLSSTHPARKFDYYTVVGNSCYFPCGPEKIHPFLILERPLDGYLNSTEYVQSGNLTVGETYEVVEAQIFHNNISYIRGDVFTAANKDFVGAGKVQYLNQKRRLTVEDEYAMSSTMCEVVIMKILTQDLKIEEAKISDIRNNSQDVLKTLPVNNG